MGGGWDSELSGLGGLEQCVSIEEQKRSWVLLQDWILGIVVCHQGLILIGVEGSTAPYVCCCLMYGDLNTVSWLAACSHCLDAQCLMATKGDACRH